MQTLGSLAEMATFRSEANAPRILVPTMGALHCGHAALIEAARKHVGADGRVVVSIFVNPTQFGPGEDFSRYPRLKADDLALCRQHGADAVFIPSVDQIYPPGDSTSIEETELSRGLCGSGRPRHFRGVCTVVAKLFHIVRPHMAIFGEKDYQQLAIIRRMVRDLFFPVEIIGHPTVRESDGLAMSSRNRFLSATEREKANKFPLALAKAATEMTPAEITATATRLITEGTDSPPEYVSLIDAETLEAVQTLTRPTVLAAAVKIGATRLIDNLQLSPRHEKF